MSYIWKGTKNGKGCLRCGTKGALDVIIAPGEVIPNTVPEESIAALVKKGQAVEAEEAQIDIGDMTKAQLVVFAEELEAKLDEDSLADLRDESCGKSALTLFNKGELIEYITTLSEGNDD